MRVAYTKYSDMKRSRQKGDEHELTPESESKRVNDASVRSHGCRGGTITIFFILKAVF